MPDPFDFAEPRSTFAVMGNPIAHSKSPQIHQLFAAQFGLSIDYERIQVDPGGFEQALSHFQANGGKGLNVTIPFKQDAWKCVDRRAPRAELAQAVNTIGFDRENNHVWGDNTDGIGLVRDMTENLGWPLKGKRILLVGAGGAARGVIEPLLAHGPERLTLTNRTLSKARELESVFSGIGKIEVKAIDKLAGERFDAVINATASSLDGRSPPLPERIFTDAALAYDLMYASEPTPFMAWAEDNGAALVSDGLGMLVEQAAESFYLWNRCRPDTAPVLKALR